MRPHPIKIKSIANRCDHLTIAEYRNFGAIDGAALRFDKDGQRGKAKFDAVVGSVFLCALSLEDKHKLGRDMQEK